MCPAGRVGAGGPNAAQDCPPAAPPAAPRARTRRNGRERVRLRGPARSAPGGARRAGAPPLPYGERPRPLGASGVSRPGASGGQPEGPPSDPLPRLRRPEGRRSGRAVGEGRLSARPARRSPSREDASVRVDRPRADPRVGREALSAPGRPKLPERPAPSPAAVTANRMRVDKVRGRENPKRADRPAASGRGSIRPPLGRTRRRPNTEPVIPNVSPNSTPTSERRPAGAARPKDAAQDS